MRKHFPMLLSSRHLNVKLPFLSLLLLFCFGLTACKKDGVKFYTLPDIHTETYDLATDWGELTPNMLKWLNFKTPTNNSRILGYMGVGMYEALVHADSTQVSLVNQLQGLTSLPQPKTGVQYYWPLVAHYTEDTLFRLLNPANIMFGEYGHHLFDSLARNIEKKYSTNIPDAVIKNSRQYGWQLAKAIYDWSATDGSQTFYNKPFDASYVFPTGPSKACKRGHPTRIHEVSS